MIALAAACALGLAAPAAADDSPKAAIFPASLEAEPLKVWLKQETDIPPSSLVAVEPAAVTAILSTISSSEGPTRRLVILRSEAANAQSFEKDRALSWTSVIVVDCKSREVRRGRTMSYAARNLMGEGRETRASSPAWAPAPASGAIRNAMLRVCDKKTADPFAPPPPVAQVQLRPAPPAAQAAPALRAAVARAVAPPAPKPAPKPSLAGAGRSAVQIGAFSAEAEANKALAAAEAEAGELPPGVSARVAKAVVGGRTLHRARFAGFAAPADAAHFCQGLKAKGRACFVPPPTAP